MAKKVPNPNGKKGCKEHQDEISKIAGEIESRGLIAVFEYLFEIVKGKKRKRYADVVALSVPDLKVVEVYQVGVSCNDGKPAKREREAIEDIEEHSEIKNIKVKFRKYSRILLIIVIFGLMSMVFLMK